MPIRRQRPRVASLAAIGFGLGVSLVSAICVDANAEEYRPIERVGRWSGIGWGDGYHACKSSGVAICSDLPPRSFSATFGDQASRGGAHASGSHHAGRYPTFYDRFDAGQIVECNSVGCGSSRCDSPGCDSASYESASCDSASCGSTGWGSVGNETAASGVALGHESVAMDSTRQQVTEPLAKSGNDSWFGSANQEAVPHLPSSSASSNRGSESTNVVPSFAASVKATAIDPVLEKSLAMDPGDLAALSLEPTEQRMIRPTAPKAVLLPPVQQMARREPEVVKVPITVRSSDSPERIQLQASAPYGAAASADHAIASSASTTTSVAKPTRLTRPIRIPFTDATAESSNPAKAESSNAEMWLSPAMNNPYVK